MIKRIIYTIKKIFLYHSNLKDIYSNKLKSINEIAELNIETLNTIGVKYLALDFDGVLAPHGRDKPLEVVEKWLDNISKQISQTNIFILSNKPTIQRKEYFKNRYPDIRFIDGVAKKPYPEGLFKIANLTHSEIDKIALVDDRLLTGSLACLIAGCKPILIKNAYVDLDNYNHKEKFFACLRRIEKFIYG